MRAPYSYAYLVAANLEMFSDFDGGYRRFGASVLVALYMVLQALFLIMLARHLGGDLFEGKSNPSFWVMLIAAFALAWLVSGAVVKHGETLTAGHDGKWKTILAIYLIPGVGMGWTLLWKLYMPFALVHIAIICFLCLSYGRYVEWRLDKPRPWGGLPETPHYPASF
ncbi:hypothetical protein ABW41_00130 [Stenotrophomonas maltophilia]|nr:hypothetical protein ABW41_00130 [Stenotrophomonas maltophilia]